MPASREVTKFGSGALTKPGEAWKLVRSLAESVETTDSDEDIGEIIAARILQAETMDQMLTPSSAPSMGQLSGKAIRVHDIRRRDGGLNKDLGFYLLVAVEAADDGEQEVYSTGAANVVTQLLWAHAHNSFPFPCKVLEVESKSNPGQMVQWLVKLDNF
jgi:hypothetical protein